MKPIELKFLFKLLGFPDYKSLISKIDLNKGTSASERDRICRDLSDRGLIDYVREIAKFRIEPAGKALLKQETSDLPISDLQLKALRACGEKSINAGDSKVPPAERQAVLQSLEAKGLIKVDKVNIKEVWLTQAGHDYLQHECKLSGTSPFNANLVQNYIDFLRTAFQSTGAPATPQVLTDSDALEPSKSPAATTLTGKPSDEEILKIIKELDSKLDTGNYLPIFHLRQKLQPPFSRDELDHTIYRLQQQDRINLSSLVEAVHYTSEQINAGIPQDAGGPLFFIEIYD
jgi:hypothetical protein